MLKDWVKWSFIAETGCEGLHVLGYTLFNITSYLEKEINNKVTDDEIMLFQIEELKVDCKDRHKILQNWTINWQKKLNTSIR